MLISEIAITDAASLIRAVEFAHYTFRQPIWWRGQSCYGWDLTPRVFREDRGFRYEQSTIILFQKRAPARHSAVPATNAKADWLFLMQHYGLPTRLLD